MSENKTVKPGKLFVYSGCSGVGKGTIMKELLAQEPRLRLSVSATTRAPRPGETNGVEYFFVTKEEFDKMVQEDGFLEHEEFCGNCYGTPRKAVEDMLAQGISVILEIEVKGGVKVIGKRPDCVSIYILPPSMEELERRLRKRATESEEDIHKRLSTASKELESAPFYEHKVINDELDTAIDQVLSIIRKEIDG